MGESKKVQFNDTEDVKEFVRAAGKCDFDIDILYEHIQIDAKSFLGVLGLGLRRELTVRCFGHDVDFEKKLCAYAVT